MSIYKTHDAQAWIEGGAASWTTLSGTTEAFSDAVNMTLKAGGRVFPEVDFDATPTDNVEIALYDSPDGSEWDDIPVSRLVVDKATDPNQISFDISGLVHWRLGFKQTGSTDSHNVRASHVLWVWTSV